MCGILGTVPSVEENLFKFSLDQLTHRGPDGYGVWSDANLITLGHRRLSIIDLSAKANQPMMDTSNRFIITYNGEIYNFIEIKKELEELGSVFYTKSDTEVILNAYRQWGERCFKKFNGMWALAIWDKTEKILFLSRDRFGEKPLFYTQLDNGIFVFASEMKAIYPFLKKVQPNSNINYHFNFLLDYEYTENTVIDGIKRIPPGYSAIFKNGRLRLNRWWNTLDNLPVTPKKYEEQVEQWRELFLDSVRIRMRSDVPIGTALSGGLDSSAVFSAMHYLSNKYNNQERQAQDWQNGFCSHFPGSSLDESKWAKIVTDAANVNLENITIDPQTSNWSINEALYQVEDPYLTLPFPMLETYRSISKKGIKVTLDGHGADELFIGYGDMPNFFSIKNFKLFNELNLIQESTKTGIYSSNKFFIKYFFIKNMLERILRKFGKTPFNILRNLYYRKVIGLNLLNHKLTFEDQEHPVYKNFDSFTKNLYKIFHITILPTLLRNYDRYSMASGVEIRMPFLDHRLVCFTFALPWTSKVGGTYTKRIIRDALKGIIPEQIRTRRDKIGWNAPLHEWFKSSLKKEIETFIQIEKLPKKIKNLFEDLQKKANPNFLDGQKLWSLLMPELWKRSLPFKNTEKYK
jgi:asparagine synthase (glutamine-hydrolysing)